ncbi:DegQ family serine endoprotease [Methylotuvimicrobium buryatense]|uniref:DegQ family serine endoprotease n=1 Tax=Methylotuvimicrobium buryatense TaxID=95641 RepID=A0A4V1IKC6_METBY|nr:DegQ family serine endoprotease [Methylotuvimicrobium buryatense]QCW84435.1 DegQ family serine endoprotease [Methylotuvimicrobium buryatense]
MKNHLFGRLLLTLVFGFLIVTQVSAGLPVAVEGQPLPSLSPILERSMPAVVNISTSTNIQVRENPLLQDPFFRHFFQLPDRPRQQQRNSLGSGVIVDSAKGYVLTNNHVIDKADKIMVTLHDGRQLDAKLIGADPEADVAVVQIAADNLVALPISNSDELRVGDFVIAIGSPFGLSQTVTSGIVSALGRSGLGIEGYEDFIQTDASINPGNSGGALVNLRGEFVGMNTAILAPGGGNVGIGFAIPANMAMTIKESLVTHGEVRRGLLGVTTQDLTPELVKAFGLKTKHGAVISKVAGNSPAAKAGLEPGDIITEVNGQKVKGSHDIRNMIGLMKIGAKVDIGFMRDDKKMLVQAEIGKPQRPHLAGKTIHPRLDGAVLSSTQKNQIEGVLFEQIATNSYPWRAGLRPGDIIVSANRYRIRTIEELAQVANPNNALLINIQRGEEAFFLVLK